VDAGDESPIVEPSIPASLQSLLGSEVEEDNTAALGAARALKSRT
jgi:hypothetical protein